MAALAGLLAAVMAAPSRAAEPPYHAIDPILADKTVTLTGHDLTFEQVVAVARDGEKVELSPEARRHQQDTFKLLLEAAAEGLPVAGLDRGPDGKAAILDGDPASPAAAAASQRQAAAFADGALPQGASATADEEAVRAAMVVRANTLPYAPASPPVADLLLAFLNDRITPVAIKGGIAKAIAAAMAGKGDVYYQGRRTTAAQALADSGLMPLAPAGLDDRVLIDSGAESAAWAAILAADGARALNWADVVYAMELDGANAGIAPLSLPAQADRPFQWLNWEAFRVLDMLKGSYLMADDPGRLPALPPLLATLPGRLGTAWMEWGVLRDAVLVALNASDQTLAFRVDLSPREAPELSSVEMKKFYVRGGRADGNRRGYVVETVNADLSPVTVPLVAFTFALEALNSSLAPSGVRRPAPDGASSPVDRTKAVIDDTRRLIAARLVAAAAAIEQRLAENPDRAMGDVPTSVLEKLRETVPPGVQPQAAQAAAYDFLARHPIADFDDSLAPPPGSDESIPLAQERIRR